MDPSRVNNTVHLLLRYCVQYYRLKRLFGFNCCSAIGPVTFQVYDSVVVTSFVVTPQLYLLALKRLSEANYRTIVSV